MNFSGIIGILATLSIFIFGIIDSKVGMEVFLDRHAIVIVIGGTLAATLLSFPVSTLYTITKVIFNRILGKSSQVHNVVISEIVNLARGMQDDTEFLLNNKDKIKSPFLKEAVELSLEGTIKVDELEGILQMRALTVFKRYDQEASIFKVIARFPPAFGLLGTTLGMIALLKGLGSPEAMQRLGPAMSIGLVATFYGVALANLVFVPIGENLSKLNKEDEIIREIIIYGMRLLREKAHPIVVEETLKSFLLPKERAKLKTAA
jgi:chemotaxis protein MotA